MATNATPSNLVRYSVQQVNFHPWFKTLGSWLNSLIPWLVPILTLLYTIASSGFSVVIDTYIHTICTNPPSPPPYHGDVLISTVYRLYARNQR